MWRQVSCQRRSVFWKSQFPKKNVVQKAKFNVVCQNKQSGRKTFQNDEMLQDPDFLENLKKSPPPPHYSPSQLSKDWYAGFLQGSANFFTGLQTSKSTRYGCQTVLYLMVSMVQSLHLMHALNQYFGYPGKIIYYKTRDTLQWRLEVKGEKICTNLIPIINQLSLFGQQMYNYAVLRAISSTKYIRKINRDPSASFVLLMCIRNRHIQQYAVQSRRKLKIKGIIALTVPKIMNGIGNVDLTEASKWRQQVVQVGGKREFGEDFVVGLVDACGTFNVSFKLTTHIWPVVEINVNLDIYGKDYALLEEIQRKFFQGKGGIYFQNNNPYLKIQKFSDVVEVVIPFFLKNPLMSSKYYSFLHFCAIVYKLNFADQLDNDVIKEIIPIAYKMNSNQVRTCDMRQYTQEQLVEYLDQVPTRQDFKQLKPQLLEIKEDLKQKWKNQKSGKKQFAI